MNAKETPISPTYYKILFAILLVLATGLAVWAGYNPLQVNATAPLCRTPTTAPPTLPQTTFPTSPPIW